MILSMIAPENQAYNHEQEAKHDPQNSIDPFYDSTNIRKIGSLQSFVRSDGPIENFSSDLFSPDEIHKIAILDLRILNLDRNECNILVQSSGITNHNISNFNNSSFSSEGDISDNMEGGLTLGSCDDA